MRHSRSSMCNDFDIVLDCFSPLASANAATTVPHRVISMASLDIVCWLTRFLVVLRPNFKNFKFWLQVLEYGVLDQSHLDSLFGYCGIPAKPGTGARLLKRASASSASSPPPSFSSTFSSSHHPPPLPLRNATPCATPARCVPRRRAVALSLLGGFGTHVFITPHLVIYPDLKTRVESRIVGKSCGAGSSRMLPRF